MKKVLFFLAIIAVPTFCLTACKESPSQKEATTDKSTPSVVASAATVFDDYYKERMKLFPFEATANGVNDYNDQFPIDISDSYRDSVGRFYEKYKAALGKMDADKLNENDKMSYEILNWDLDIAIEALKFQDNLMPVNQFSSKTLDLGQLGSGEGSQPFKTVKDYDNWLKRIANFPAWADTAISNMKRGMLKGLILPKSLVVKVLPQLKPLAETATSEHLFFGPIKKMATIAEIDNANKGRLTTEYTNMIETNVKPTYKKLHDFIKNEYLPKARASSGISAVPDGDKYYAYLTKYWTTTSMTPDQIFELGQKEVARIRAEMEKVKTEVGFKGDLKAFFKHVTEGEPKLRPFNDPKKVIANFNAIHQKMKPQLEKQFDMVPKTTFEVRRTEAFREASAPYRTVFQAVVSFFDE